MAKQAIPAIAARVRTGATRNHRGRRPAPMRTLALFGGLLLLTGCATTLPGALSDFSEMKAEVSVPIWRNILFQAPYRKILESAGPVADRHCASVGREPVFVSLRGADIRSSVQVVGIATNSGEAIVLYRCEKERDDVEESVRLELAAISPEMVIEVWDKLSETERRRLKDDEPFRRALNEGARRTVFAEMDRVLEEVRQTQSASASAAAPTPVDEPT